MRGCLASLLVAALAAGAGACSRPPPESTPDGAVREWLEAMAAAGDDVRARRDAYALLGPAARANLAARADRTSLLTGQRVEPYEMLAPGRFGLRFRPRSMKATVTDDRATVDVLGESRDERATVRCVREGTGEAAAWRVEPELPEPPARKRDAGP
jgi:hypothetical protein